MGKHKPRIKVKAEPKTVAPSHVAACALAVVVSLLIAWHLGPSPADGLIPGAPEFVPAAGGQAADSAAGAVLVLAIDGAGTGKPRLVILDGETMKVAATLALPILPLASAGLHNHWSAFPTST